MTTPEDAARAPVAIISHGRDIDLVRRGGRAVALVGAHTGSRFRSVNRIELDAGGETVDIRHAGEAVYLVAEGSGRVELPDSGEQLALRRRSILYVPPRRAYRLEAPARGMLVFGGPCPPDGGSEPAEGDGLGGSFPRGALVLDPERDGAPIPIISANARLVVWPRMGARIASMNFVVLEPGEENQPHAHPTSDDTIVILEGWGSIEDLASERHHQFRAGDVVHVEAGVPHRVKADHGARIVSAGGPCPPDQQLLAACGLA